MHERRFSFKQKKCMDEISFGAVSKMHRIVLSSTIYLNALQLS